MEDFFLFLLAFTAMMLLMTLAAGVSELIEWNYRRKLAKRLRNSRRGCVGQDYLSKGNRRA